MRDQPVGDLVVVGAVIGIMTLDDLLRILVAEVSALFGITDKGQKREQHLRR
jgi:hypothetical protein